LQHSSLTSCFPNSLVGQCHLEIRRHSTASMLLQLHLRWIRQPDGFESRAVASAEVAKTLPSDIVVSCLADNYRGKSVSCASCKRCRQCLISGLCAVWMLLDYPSEVSASCSTAPAPGRRFLLTLFLCSVSPQTKPGSGTAAVSSHWR
jgi:hypothetical protein